MAAFIVWSFILGTPGLDLLTARDLNTAQQRQQARELAGPFGAAVAIAVADFNREVRLPVVARLEWTQRYARISQNWSLYRDGPSKVRRLEVYVDGELKHRSADPAYPWLNPQLRSRRIRPVVESTGMMYASKNWEGLTRVIVHFAQRDFPGCQEVRLVATEGPFPGRKLEPKYSITAKAPDWEADKRWDPSWADKRDES
ncbi:MAG: hypothetical protein H6740_17180 [Alphaproteobacteria bacterium]|nr:hypothetical protein [Alphaproteobacteria bacterium]